MSAETSERAAHDVADVVHAGLARIDADCLESRDHGGRALDPVPANLNLLASGDIHHPAGGIAGDAGQGAGLLAAQDAIRYPDAHHEEAGNMATGEDAVPLHADLVRIGHG